jgi:hypothetical protein
MDILHCLKCQTMCKRSIEKVPTSKKIHVRLVLMHQAAAGHADGGLEQDCFRVECGVRPALPAQVQMLMHTNHADWYASKFVFELQDQAVLRAVHQSAAGSAS